MSKILSAQENKEMLQKRLAKYIKNYLMKKKRQYCKQIKHIEYKKNSNNRMRKK